MEQLIRVLNDLRQLNLDHQIIDEAANGQIRIELYRNNKYIKVDITIDMDSNTLIIDDPDHFNYSIDVMRHIEASLDPPTFVGTIRLRKQIRRLIKITNILNDNKVKFSIGYIDKEIIIEHEQFDIEINHENGSMVIKKYVDDHNQQIAPFKMRDLNILIQFNLI